MNTTNDMRRELEALRGEVARLKLTAADKESVESLKSSIAAIVNPLSLKPADTQRRITHDDYFGDAQLGSSATSKSIDTDTDAPAFQLWGFRYMQTPDDGSGSSLVIPYPTEEDDRGDYKFIVRHAGGGVPQLRYMDLESGYSEIRNWWYDEDGAFYEETQANVSGGNLGAGRFWKGVLGFATTANPAYAVADETILVLHHYQECFEL